MSRKVSSIVACDVYQYIENRGYDCILYVTDDFLCLFPVEGKDGKPLYIWYKDVMRIEKTKIRAWYRCLSVETKDSKVIYLYFKEGWTRTSFLVLLRYLMERSDTFRVEKKELLGDFDGIDKDEKTESIIAELEKAKGIQENVLKNLDKQREDLKKVEREYKHAQYVLDVSDRTLRGIASISGTFVNLVTHFNRPKQPEYNVENWKTPRSFLPPKNCKHFFVLWIERKKKIAYYRYDYHFEIYPEYLQLRFEDKVLYIFKLGELQSCQRIGKYHIAIRFKGNDSSIELFTKDDEVIATLLKTYIPSITVEDKRPNLPKIRLPFVPKGNDPKTNHSRSSVDSAKSALRLKKKAEREKNLDKISSMLAKDLSERTHAIRDELDESNAQLDHLITQNQKLTNHLNKSSKKIDRKRQQV